MPKPAADHGLVAWPSRSRRRAAGSWSSSTCRTGVVFGSITPVSTLNLTCRLFGFAQRRVVVVAHADSRSQQSAGQVQHRHRRRSTRTRRRSTSRRRRTSSRASARPTRPPRRPWSAAASASSSAPARPRTRFSRLRRRSRQHDAVVGRAARVPARSGRRAATSSTIRTTARTSRAPTGTIHDSRADLPVHRVGPAGARRRHGRDRGLRRRAGTQPVPAQHREPDRQVVTNPNPASARVRDPRVLDRHSATPTGTVTGVQNPYAEIDYKTSGGHDSYNALQLA